MSEKSNVSLLDPVAIVKWEIERPFIRQMNFLPIQGLNSLNSLARDRGVGLSPFNEDVERLWQMGGLRADLIASKRQLDIEGLAFIQQNESGEYLYADVRDCVNKAEGLGNVFEDLEGMPADVYLMFHPFRYYVLYRIEQELVPHLGSFQILRSAISCQKAVERFVTAFNEKTANELFRSSVRRWNEITSLAVAVEPFTFSKLFGYYKVPHPDIKDEGEFYSALRKQYEDCKKLLIAIGLDEIKSILTDLCKEAKRLEPNDDIRRLIRLTKRYRIEGVKGKLGGSVYLLTMAEMIRRAAERVFETELPEEDELGFGGGSETADYKEYFYGTHRLLDSHEAKSTFIRTLNLDYSVRLRWYVEGVTELNALQSELSGDENIEIINLRGEVVAGKGKGLSFRENLLNDMRRSVYSFVSLDRDVDYNLRVLDKAIEAREMFGMSFINDPDFEFGNFNSDELAGILWELALEKGAPAGEKENFLKLTSSAKNGNQLSVNESKALPNFQKLTKSKIWGERLLNFARENPYLQRNGQKITRPFLEAIMLARHTIECDYYLSREEGRVDKKTRKIVSVKKYFAYGSNMLKERLVERVPSALVRATGYIEGYKISYNKRSKDGSGKCNLVKTEDDNDKVYGVVYDFLDGDKPALDKYEGLGRGYNAIMIKVIAESENMRAYTYVADDSAIDDSLKPYSWYKDLVIEGARRHSLPPEYIMQLDSFEANSDLDAEREKQNRKLLGR